MQFIIEVINAKIREIGIKQTVLAERVRMTDDALGKCLSGKRRLRGDELVDLCQVLGLDISDFRKPQDPPQISA